MSHYIYLDRDTGEFVSEKDYDRRGEEEVERVEILDADDLEDFDPDDYPDDYFDVVDYDGSVSYGEDE